MVAEKLKSSSARRNRGNLITYFEQFVSNIEPTEERVASVSESHTTLRTHLTEDAKLLHPIGDSFLSGSYARHTATDPVKDADIIVILTETEVSEDRTSPAPRSILEDTRSAIDEFYDDVNLETQRRSIQVLLSEVDVRMDVVPAIAPNGKDQRLFVPDRDQGKWIASHPKAHINYARDTNAASGGFFVRVVKASKHWRGRCLDAKKAPKSFLLETILAHHSEPGAPTLCIAFEDTVRNVVNDYRSNRQNGTVPHVQDPGIEENDLAKTCGWSFEEFAHFFDELEKLLAIAERANAPETSKAETIRLWQSVFGDAYPSSMSEEQETRFSKSDAAVPTRRELPHRVLIEAHLANGRNSATQEAYASNGRKIAKNRWLRFRIRSTDVPRPYQVKWVVQNHGAEARRDRYHFAWGNDEHWESTLFRGHHDLFCEIYRDGRLVARARHIVNIG